jgi:hypothetical protein
LPSQREGDDVSDLQKILVLTPVKTAAAHLPRYVELLERLEWPREQLNLGILEGDSSDDTVDMLKQARFAMEFCAIESCGKCTPCRIGAVRGVETLDKIAGGERSGEQVDLLKDLCDTMKAGSLCALGGFTPYPVLSALTHFPQDFTPRPMAEAAE